jgi:hypothetical protein
MGKAGADLHLFAWEGDVMFRLGTTQMSDFDDANEKGIARCVRRGGRRNSKFFAPGSAKLDCDSFEIVSGVQGKELRIRDGRSFG